MARLYAHVGTFDGPLKERPEVLKAVRVDHVFADIPLGVVNDFVHVSLAHVLIDGLLIGVDFRAAFDVITNQFHHGLFAGHFGENFVSDDAGMLGVTVKNSNNRRLGLHAVAGG